MNLPDAFREGNYADKQMILRNFIEIALGASNLTKRVRALRAAEEMIELAQAMDVDAETLHMLIVHVYSRPTGMISQEIGGVLVTMAVLCDSLGLTMQICYETEAIRLLRMDTDKLRQRNKAKEDAGFGNTVPNSFDEYLKTTLPVVPPNAGGEEGDHPRRVCPTCSRSDGTHDESCVEHIPF